MTRRTVTWPGIKMCGSVVRVSDGTSKFEIIIVQWKYTISELSQSSHLSAYATYSRPKNKYNNIIASHLQLLRGNMVTCALSTMSLDSPNPVLFGNHWRVSILLLFVLFVIFQRSASAVQWSHLQIKHRQRIRRKNILCLCRALLDSLLRICCAWHDAEWGSERLWFIWLINIFREAKVSR